MINGKRFENIHKTHKQPVNLCLRFGTELCIARRVHLLMVHNNIYFILCLLGDYCKYLKYVCETRVYNIGHTTKYDFPRFICNY